MDNFKTADLCDDHVGEVEVCQMDFLQFGKRKRFSGPIETVHVYEDNVIFVDALESVPAGSVIVVNGGGSRNCALMGDRLAGIAESRGIAGVIINGYIRDSVDINGMDVGVFALGTNPLKSNKNGIGERDVSFTFGNVQFNKGDYVYADEDGVIVTKHPLK